MSAGVLLFILMLILAFIGFPIYIALGASVIVALSVSGLPMVTVPQKVFTGIRQHFPAGYTILHAGRQPDGKGHHQKVN